MIWARNVLGNGDTTRHPPHPGEDLGAQRTSSIISGRPGTSSVPSQCLPSHPRDFFSPSRPPREPPQCHLNAFQTGQGTSSSPPARPGNLLNAISMPSKELPQRFPNQPRNFLNALQATQGTSSTPSRPPREAPQCHLGQLRNFLSAHQAARGTSSTPSKLPKKLSQCLLGYHLEIHSRDDDPT